MSTKQRKEGNHGTNSVGDEGVVRPSAWKKDGCPTRNCFNMFSRDSD